MQVKIFSFFLLYVLSSFFSTNMYCMRPQPKNYTEQDAEMLLSDLATMNQALAYTVALSIPDNLKNVILNSNVKKNFEIFLSHHHQEYFSAPQLIPNLDSPIINLNYVKPISIDKIRKSYGDTRLFF